MECKLCGNKDMYPYYFQGDKNQFVYYKCSDCAIVSYDIKSGTDQKKYVTGRTQKGYRKKSQTDKEKTYSFIKSNIPLKGTLLDIGCGGGRLLYIAKKDGWQVKGIDISPEFAKSAMDNWGIEVEITDFLKYDPGTNSLFDVIILRHVLEHMINPVEVMEKVFSLLKDDGYCVLEFPNIESLEMRIKRFISGMGVHKKKYPPYYVPGHFNEFCYSSFRYLTQKTGFEILKWETYASNPLFDFLYKTIHIGNKARTLIKKQNGGKD